MNVDGLGLTKNDFVPQRGPVGEGVDKKQITSR